MFCVFVFFVRKKENNSARKSETLVICPFKEMLKFLAFAIGFLSYYYYI